jgi:hypothetical protein
MDFDFDMPSVFTGDEFAGLDDYEDEFACLDDDYIPPSPPRSPYAVPPPSPTPFHFPMLIVPDTYRPMSTDVYESRYELREKYTKVLKLVSADAMFAGLSWSRLKLNYQKNGAFNFQEYRTSNDTCQFYVVDSTSRYNSQDFKTTWSPASSRPAYKKRQDNCDHHMIPPLCCDYKKRSLMWIPLDISLRPSFFSDVHGQPVFADYIQPQALGVRTHPIRKYRTFLHGVDHEDIYKPLRGYYPISSDMNGGTTCHIPREKLWAEREPLTATDGFDIMKKLARVDPNSWTNIMSFLPFNEKCGLAQYLSSDTCDQLYGVQFPTIKPAHHMSQRNSSRFIFTSNLVAGLYDTGRFRLNKCVLPGHQVYAIFSLFMANCEKQEAEDHALRIALFNHTPSVKHSTTVEASFFSLERVMHFGNRPLGVFRKRLVGARMHEVASIRAMLRNARTMKPFDVLWRLKTVYDLSNFCNRHDVRRVALENIASNIQDHIVPTIESICRRMTDICVTRVECGGSQEQAHLAARHVVDHNNYMQAWQDLSTLTCLARFDGEPTQEEVRNTYAKWHLHSTHCKSNGVVPQFHVPLLHTHWHINRVHSLIQILYRYTGKNYNDLLRLVYDSDCALRHDVCTESAKGRTTVLNLLSYQISCSFDIDMKRVYKKCLKYNYQEMDCSASTPTDGIHACPIGAMCYGCDCHPSTKLKTAQYVEHMFALLDTYQELYDIAYDDHFPLASYTASAVQYENHRSRKRFSMESTPSARFMANVDHATIQGIEPLLNGSATQFLHPPVAYDALRLNKQAS